MSAAKTDALAGGAAQGIEEKQTSTDPAQCSSASNEGQAFELVACKEDRRADSRLLARHLGIQHKNLFEQINAYKAEYEATGKLAFKTEASESGQTMRFALLNEDQCFLALSFSKNTHRVRELKVKMVQAFGEARRAAELRKAEYLPGYHAAHQTIHTLAAGSENERFIHMNFNRLVNKVAGIESGHRSGAALPQQALLIVAQMAAAQAMQGAADHKDGYNRAKQALAPLAALTQAQAAPPKLTAQEGCNG